MKAPIGTFSDAACKLACRVRRLMRNRPGDGPYLAWAEHGDIYAQAVGTDAAKRVLDRHPEYVIGLYSRQVPLRYIEADIEAIQVEATA